MQQRTVTATFNLKTYSITASAGNGGSISPSGTVTVNYGGSQSFTITPDANYTIGNVVVDGSQCRFSDNLQLCQCDCKPYNQCKLYRSTAKQPERNKDRFRQRCSDLLPLPGINCGSDCSEVYTSGTVVTLTAAPDSSSSFRRLVRRMQRNRHMLGYHERSKKRNSHLYPEDLYDNGICRQWRQHLSVRNCDRQLWWQPKLYDYT